MKLFAILLGFLLLPASVAATPAPAQKTESVTLAPGQTISLSVDVDGGISVLDRTHDAALTDFDRATLGILLRGDYASATGPNAREFRSNEPGIPAAPAITPGRIKASFLQIGDGSQTLLIMENGYDRGLLYRARITSNGRSAPTDVCIVIPRGRGHEHWPFAIDQIEISSLRLEAWDESQGPRCE